MTEFYYYCGNPTELRATPTKYLFAQYVHGHEKLLHIHADNLEKTEPFGWGEFVLYNVEPSFLTFNVLKGTNLVSLHPYNNLIDSDLDWWSARASQLIAPYESHSTTLQLTGTPDISKKIILAKEFRRKEISRITMCALSKTIRQNRA